MIKIKNKIILHFTIFYLKLNHIKEQLKLYRTIIEFKYLPSLIINLLFSFFLLIYIRISLFYSCILSCLHLILNELFWSNVIFLSYT